MEIDKVTKGDRHARRYQATPPLTTCFLDHGESRKCEQTPRGAFINNVGHLRHFRWVFVPPCLVLEKIDLQIRLSQGVYENTRM